jgi:hypothetical protein
MVCILGGPPVVKNARPLTEQQITAIKNYVNNPNRKLVEAAQSLHDLERLREKGEVPNSLIAFEILKTIHAGIEHGFTNDDLLGTIPKALGDETITIPVAAIRSLLSAWNNFKYSDDPNMAKSFGLDGAGQGRKPITKLEIHKNERYYTRRIFELRMFARMDFKKLTVDVAAEQVAEEESVSVQSVKNAYKKYRRNFAELFKEHGIPLK